ncbi:right-handed parallel beta-helix repeat-containing protein [uncultured Alistipes sp.]|uniref:right-handed parallel beta-helix repeat-containing protein n=1 Tax=uncultured Alistipes sp. TaxID=538949 RepID=UPI0025D06409|nr:right-handed parallel beta-helix repeat-containing protein [uncultured Alistipes sp.]
MKRTLRNLCAALLACLTISAAPAAEKVVYLKDFLTPGAAETDAVPAVRAALEHCAATGARKLVLPGGRLCMRPDQAVEKYQFISNNDESLKRIAFDLAGMRDFEIDGGGTELLFTGFISPFSLEECENITIRDLTIDFTRTFNSEGIVEAAGDGWLEIRFPEDYLCDIVNGCLRFRDTEGTVYPFSNLLEFDAVRREPAFRATDYWLSNRTIPAEKCENGNIRILCKDLKATVGNVMVFGAAARYNPGFTLADCRGVVIRDVNLYHCGGMGVIAQRSRDIELRKLVIVPSPGKGRMISITADATHYVNCGGYIRMIDCVFENQKDDATNIHGLYMAVERVAGPDKLLLRWRNSGQYGVDFIVPGMRLELVDNDNVETYAHRSVKSVKRLNKVYTEVTFTEPLPDGVKPLHVVAADDDYPEVLIKGCHMRGNRARGLLLGSRGRTVVEDNRFHIAGAAILIEGDANYWYEQSGVRDVVIRGNVFENGNYGSPGWGAACIAVGSGIPNRETSRYHRNIRVEGNTFRVFDPRIINLYCVDGFLFRRNKIEFTTDYPVVDGQAERFVTRNCDNVVIE